MCVRFVELYFTVIYDRVTNIVLEEIMLSHHLFKHIFVI